MIKQVPIVDRIWQLRVTLRNSQPSIWRLLHIPWNFTLFRLHLALQQIMGWNNSHLHLFKVGTVKYSEPGPHWDMAIKDEGKTLLARIAPKPGDTIEYEYDLGDGWIHDILVEEIITPDENKRYPVCVDGARACPPEDCGGIYGYETLLEILGNPDHEQHQEMTEWIGGPFDPDAFDIKVVNRILTPRLPDPTK